MSFLARRERLLLVAGGETVSVWDADTGTPVGEPINQSGPVYDARIHPGRLAHPDRRREQYRPILEPAKRLTVGSPMICARLGDVRGHQLHGLTS